MRRRLLFHVSAIDKPAALRAAWFGAIAVVSLSSPGCSQRPDAGPVVASTIGSRPELTDAAAGHSSLADRVLRDSTAQGLVRFDAAGQIEPGLAERWTVIDNGMSYIFRLREAEWGDGRRVTAGDVVTVLDRELNPRSRNPLAPYLSAIDEAVEMTPEVIEVRLKRPRPDLLKLFAQPELNILRVHPPGGSGPFRIARRTTNGVVLRPVFDPARVEADEFTEPGPSQTVELIGERASRAVTRFMAHQSDVVLGGNYVDWPLLPIAGVAPANLRVDPAAGLFGLAIAHRTGFLADPANRAALAQAIDRNAIVAAFAPGWAAAEQILPEQLDSAAPPAVATWQTLSSTDRHTAARAQVKRWQQAHPGPIQLTLALPKGPGATILYGFIGAAFRSIGVELTRAPEGSDADLRVVDEVAPYDSARWYLATACAPCIDSAAASLLAARDAQTLTERAQHIATADGIMASDTPFIVIARPLRWSLVALRLRAWQPNARAWHPLNHLRADAS